MPHDAHLSGCTAIFILGEETKDVICMRREVFARKLYTLEIPSYDWSKGQHNESWSDKTRV